MTGSVRPRGTAWGDRLYFAFFGCYLGGLLLWLLLGLVPPITLAVPTLTRTLESLATGGGPLAGFAQTVMDNQAMMPSGGSVALEYLFSLLNLALGVLITVRRPYGAVPRLLALACIGTAATFNEPSHVVFHLLTHAPLVTAVHFMFHIVSGLAYLWAVVLFPDGRLPSRWLAGRRRLAWAVGVAASALVLLVCYRSSFISHPPFFVAFFGILVPVVGITAQSVRLHEPELAPVSRQQSALLRAALAPALLAAVLWLAGHAVEALGGSGHGGAAHFADAVQSLFPAVFAVVPVMIFVAILRYRLWDIDVVVSRALVYALLVGVVVVAYGAALALAGRLFGGGIWSTLAAFVVVALLAEPARQRCRRLANRLVFGTVLTPRESMQALVDRLTATTSANELAELAGLVVAGTRCTSAQVWLASAEGWVCAAAAPAGDTGQTDLGGVDTGSIDALVAAMPGWSCTPVTHEGRLLAVLAVRTPSGVGLPPAEADLIDDLAGHAGLLVANALLAAELAREVARVSDQAAELVSSRQLVVVTQDAQRLSLERNIHDGAQQELVATLVQIRALARRPERAGASGRADARAMAARARSTIEELCTGGGPAVLLDRGLGPALEEAAQVARRAGLVVDVRSDVSERLPPDVEAALYFSCRECLQNTAKHARASRVVVRVSRDGDEVVLTVRDDGTGFDVAAAARGSGLANLVARMAGLGGSLTVDSAPGAGTTTTCRLPAQAATLTGATT